MSNNKQQTVVDRIVNLLNKEGFAPVLTEEEIKSFKEMEKEQELRLIKFTSEIFELGKSHFSYALITNEEILELYNETNETINKRNSK
jgi:uncharacterized protein YllA (UPF0747 family)